MVSKTGPLLAEEVHLLNWHELLLLIDVGDEGLPADDVVDWGRAAPFLGDLGRVFDLDAERYVRVLDILAQLDGTCGPADVIPVRCLKVRDQFCGLLHPGVANCDYDSSAQDVDMGLHVGHAFLRLHDLFEESFELRLKCWRHSQLEVVEVDLLVRHQVAVQTLGNLTS